MRAVRSAVLCGFLGFAPAARAAPHPASSPSAQPFRLVFRSSTACTDSREFVTKLLSRTSGLRPARGDESGLIFQVDLVPTSAGVRGQLEVTELHGTPTVRVIPASDCHEVLSAMALIAALMVDPFASNAPTFGPMPPAPVSGRKPPGAPRTDAPKETPPFDFGFGQRLSVQSGVLPGEALGFSLFADLGYSFGEIARPTLRFAGIYAKKSVPRGAAEAAFTWWTARLSACPVRFAGSDWLEIRPCAFWDSGVLRAQGTGADVSEPASSVFWSATGVAIDVEARLLGPLTLGAELGAIFPLVRDRFFFDPEGPEQAIHAVPAAGWSLALGLGLRFY